MCGHPFHDIAHDIELRIELRLLLQVADRGAIGEPGLAVPLGVDARHDAQQRRLARAVGAEHADLGIGVKLQVNVVENLLAAGIGLRQAVHVIDELACHRVSALPDEGMFRRRF